MAPYGGAGEVVLMADVLLYIPLACMYLGNTYRYYWYSRQEKYWCIFALGGAWGDIVCMHALGYPAHGSGPCQTQGHD